MDHYQPRRADWIAPPRPPTIAAAAAEAFFSGRRPDLSALRNAFWYFRKTFQLPSSPQEATARISADARYHLYINGSFVGRGPSRCDPSFQSFDTRDLTPYLSERRNVVAVLLHSYGRDMSWYQLAPVSHLAAYGCAGLFFQCDVDLENGSSVQIDSDASWRWRKADAWQQDTMPGSVGYMEVFDARLAVERWAATDFDDGDWAEAEALTAGTLNRASPARPFRVMVPRAIPFLFEEERTPASVLSVREVESQAEAGDPYGQAEQEVVVEATAGRVEGAESLPEGGAATVSPHPARGAAIVFDFGDTVTGYPRLDLSAPTGAIVDVSYAERLQDGRPELNPRRPLMSSNVHRYIAREGRQQWEKVEWAGFRYLEVTVRNPQGPVTLHKVAVNQTGYPVEERGSFECSDDLLNRIWQAGAKTVRLCMHDGYEDCPSREQRQWLGDAYTESLTNYAAFGDTQLVAQMLRQGTQSQRPDGMTPMATPGDLAARSFLSIPDWGLCWVLSLGKYVDYTGDLELAVEVLPSVMKLLDWFDRLVDDDGLLDRVPEWNFVDWADVDRRGEGTAYNALYYRTLRVAEELALRLDMDLIAARCAQRADRVRDAINALLWDEKSGVYADCRVDGVLSRRISQQSNSLCIAYGVAPEERWDRIFNAILDDSRLSITPTGMRMEEPPAEPFDDECNVVTAQPYFMHHVHRALVAGGRYDELLRNIRRRWGAMLDAGATTIWEVWHPLVSQCHGWATTPTFDLSTEVLGVSPLEPGFARVRIAPHPVDLKWARGVFPTVKGDIHVEWENDNDRFKLSASIPAGCAAEVTLPSHPHGWKSVLARDGGDVLTSEAARASAGVSDIGQSNEGITLVVEGKTELKFEARS